MSRDLQMKGMKELDAYLAALPMNMQKNAVRQALTAAAAPIRDEARLRVPKKSGKLARAIRSGSPRQNEDGSFSISVSVTGNDHGFLGYFFEYGVRPHGITLKRNRGGKAGKNAAAREAAGNHVAKVFKIGDRFVSGEIMHPGFRAQPFLVPALDIRADDAIAAFAGRIRDYLEGVKTKTGYDVVGGLAEAA